MILIDNLAFSMRNDLAVEDNTRQSMIIGKTLLAGFFSTDCSNGQNCHTKHNYLSINEYKTNQKRNNRSKNKRER